MRIVFLACNDEFAGNMQRHIYERHPEWVVGSVISTCYIYKKNMIGSMIFLLTRSGILYTAKLIEKKIFRKALDRTRVCVPLKLAREHNVQVYRCSNINDDRSIAQLAAWGPDLIISTNFNQYIGRRARAASGRGTWNLHKSFLPHYRGMAPSFYSLLNGERTVGATLHKIARGFDTGDIVCQIEVPVCADDSVHSLNLRVSELGGEMLAQFLEQADLWDVKALPQPEGEWPDHTYPSRKDVKAFLERGGRF